MSTRARASASKNAQTCWWESKHGASTHTRTQVHTGVCVCGCAHLLVEEAAEGEHGQAAVLHLLELQGLRIYI